MWQTNEYKQWLKDRLNEVKNDLDFKDFSVEVYNEQDYAKHRSIKPKTITVVIKFLSDTKLFSVRTQPVQTLVITEENGIGVANSIFSRFAEIYNFAIVSHGTTYVKHMYSSPTVLSNFNLIGIGLRTVLYVNTTLFILEDVMDITDLEIDGEKIQLLSATIGYTMTGDTQPFGGGYAKTEKNFSTFTMVVTVPCVKNNFTEKCVKLMNMGKGTPDYPYFDASFDVSFSVAELEFEFDMKLTGATLTTAANNVPSLQLSFTV